MADKNQDTNPNDQPEQPTGDPPQGDQQVPYTRFKEVIDQRKEVEKQNTKLKSDMEKLQQQLKEREDAGKSELDKLTEQVNSLTSNLEQERRQRMQIEAATNAGLPVELASRLSGESAEEIADDAKRLAEYLKPVGGGNPVHDPRRGAPVGSFDFEGKTPAEIRDAVKDGKVKLR